MDHPAIRTIAQGTLITCESVCPRVPKCSQTHLFVFTAVITGLGVGAFESLQGRHAGMLASASALNGGIVAATFFSECYLRLV